MGAECSCQYLNSSQSSVCNWFFRPLVQFGVDSGEHVCDTSNRGKTRESRERNVSVYWRRDNSVRARTPAFGLIDIRMEIIGIRLQTWTRVIVNRCIAKIIARDLSLVASRLYRMAVTRPQSRVAVTLYRQNRQWDAPCPIMKMSVNRASTILGLAWSVIWVALDQKYP